jgi:hypothetical protein
MTAQGNFAVILAEPAYVAGSSSSSNSGIMQQPT